MNKVNIKKISFKLKNFLIISSIVLISSLFVAPNFILAQEEEQTPSPTKSQILDNTKRVGNSAGYANADKSTLITTLANTVKMALSFLGIIFLILILISGFQWMTAGGNEDAIKKAKARIKNATIGFIIIVSSYSIVFFIEFLIAIN